MQHFPIFLDTRDKKIVVVGGGEAALAKLRLLIKTEADITVFAENPLPEVVGLTSVSRRYCVGATFGPGDAIGATLVYAATEDPVEDARISAIARAEGAMINIVDNLEDSQFITPAIVDRDPVTVAIGTEGAAPVLARAIKKDLEAKLSPRLGVLARIGKAFRPMAEKLPMGRARREFWADYYFDKGPRTKDPKAALNTLLETHLEKSSSAGHVDFVGAGPGDPELLTLKARNTLDRADVVIHDRLIAPEILELARREAIVIEAGKTGFGPAMAQNDINDLIVEHCQKGHHVVRLKSGDPSVFGRLDEEIDAVSAHSIEWQIVPGITSASAAVAAIGQSLTKRSRNGSVRFLTGHDMQGFADHDWKTLAEKGQVAAIYMGKKSARFLQGRLLMHGADVGTPVTVVENISRRDQRILHTTLGKMEPTMTNAGLSGPALTLYGLAPRAAVSEVALWSEEIA